MPEQAQVDYDDQSDFPRISEFGPFRVKHYIRESAWELLLMSARNGKVVSPEEAFSLAESFVAEAMARGY